MRRWCCKKFPCGAVNVGAKKDCLPPNESAYSRAMRTILLILLVLLLIGALPTWPYSSGWGYFPSGGLVLLIIVVLLLVKA